MARPTERRVARQFGDRVRELRAEKAYTQETLAEATGFHRNYIGGIERGERNVTFTVLCEICAALKIRIAQLRVFLRPQPSEHQPIVAGPVIQYQMRTA